MHFNDQVLSMARKNLEIVNKYINEEEHNETTEASQYDEKKKVGSLLSRGIIEVGNNTKKGRGSIK